VIVIADVNDFVTDSKVRTGFIKILINLNKASNGIAIITGRKYENRPETIDQINSYGLGFSWLLMRHPECDDVPIDELKKNLYETHVKPYQENILCVFESDPKCIEMWRGLGLTCIDCRNI